MPHVFLICLLTNYEKGEQKYVVERFTNLGEMINYFDSPLFEYGEIITPPAGGEARYFFAGAYPPITP